MGILEIAEKEEIVRVGVHLQMTERKSALEGDHVGGVSEGE